MSTNFFIRHKGSHDEGLHVAKRTGTSRWSFQGLYPSKRFITTMGKDPEVYQCVEDFKDILPKGIHAITSASDWIYVLENLSDNAEFYSENKDSEDTQEIISDWKNSTPQPIDAYCDRLEKEMEQIAGSSSAPISQELLYSLREDEFVDSRGWVFSYRSFF